MDACDRGALIAVSACDVRRPGRVCVTLWGDEHSLGLLCTRSRRPATGRAPRPLSGWRRATAVSAPPDGLESSLEGGCPAVTEPGYCLAAACGGWSAPASPDGAAGRDLDGAERLRRDHPVMLPRSPGVPPVHLAPRLPAAGIQDRAEVERGDDDEPQAMSIGHGRGPGGGLHGVGLLGRWRGGPRLGVVQDAVGAGRELAAAYRALKLGGGGEGDDWLARTPWHPGGLDRCTRPAIPQARRRAPLSGKGGNCRLGAARRRRRAGPRRGWCAGYRDSSPPGARRAVRARA